MARKKVLRAVDAQHFPTDGPRKRQPARQTQQQQQRRTPTPTYAHRARTKQYRRPAAGQQPAKGFFTHLIEMMQEASRTMPMAIFMMVVAAAIVAAWAVVSMVWRGWRD
ncbi:hypothetical protein CLCR_03765 [Cladophialophora carrionii]|uniref:Uncharacterized protein n=1 Tax=Cladophialophora carrionii TaxID=86049 RepID=A0A1C1CG04_9EURO|nr:hypothetical protein CLCR_03765 [Cladophialophora carrionii]